MSTWNNKTAHRSLSWKEQKKIYSHLFSLCRRYLWLIASAVILEAAGSVLTLLGPDQLSRLTDCITDGISSQIDLHQVSSIGLTLVCFYCGSYLLTAARAGSWLR